MKRGKREKGERFKEIERNIQFGNAGREGVGEGGRVGDSSHFQPREREGGGGRVKSFEDCFRKFIIRRIDGGRGGRVRRGVFLLG